MLYCISVGIILMRIVVVFFIIFFIMDKPDIKRILRKGGLLISDNILQEGEIVESRYAVTRRNRTIHTRIREYVYELTHTKDFVTSIVPIGDGITLSVKQ